jgi:hypothetical protein
VVHDPELQVRVCVLVPDVSACPDPLPLIA